MKLETLQIKLIEIYWANLSDYKKELYKRGLELKSSKQSVEECEYYQYLQRVISTIENLRESVQGELKDFVELRYFQEDSYLLSWEDIADELGISKRKAYLLRNKLAEYTAKELGLIPR